MNTTPHVNISLEQKMKNLQRATWDVAKQCRREQRHLSADHLVQACQSMKAARDALGTQQSSDD